MLPIKPGIRNLDVATVSLHAQVREMHRAGACRRQQRFSDYECIVYRPAADDGENLMPAAETEQEHSQPQNKSISRHPAYVNPGPFGLS